MTRQRFCRAAVVFGGLVLAWTIVVLWTGGAVFYVGGIRISSRGPRNALLLTSISLALAWVLAPAGQRTRTLSAECRRLLDLATPWLSRIPATPRTAQVVAALAAAGVVIVGFSEGAFVINGSDSYGYVSQAHLWTIGELRQEPPLRGSVPADITLDVLSPLGYRPSVDGTTIAPTYSPGLPMVMAVFERLAGPDSVFWVVPLLGGVLVWATYLLGRRMGGPLVGAVAAVLVATSPPVFFQLTDSPMSDLAAAAWWTLAIVMVCRDTRPGALAAGAAAGLAVLTRPNLVPLLAIVGGLLIVRLVAARRPLRNVIQHSLLFGIFVVAACGAIGVINHTLWGSALVSGYGSLGYLFKVANIWPNLLTYTRAVVTQMPIVLALPLAAFLRKKGGERTESDRIGRLTRLALWACMITVFAGYVSYPPFDSAWSLRFLLPLVAPLLVLASVSAVSLATRMIETERAACLLAMLIICGYGVNHARKVGAFELEHLRRYAAIGGYITRELPDRTVLLAMLHSGSATYYTGRPTLRWDLLPPERLDTLVDELRQRGLVPYLLLDKDERDPFIARYRGHSRLAALDWAPLVTLKPVEVHIYAIPPLP